VAVFDPRVIDPNLILSRRVGVIGFGSQGHAHALNLRDSGVEVRIGLYAGSPSRTRAEAMGFEVLPVPEVAGWADVIVLAVPDVPMAAIFSREIAPALRARQALVFIHGFNIRYGTIVAPRDVDVLLVSPKGPGPRLRAEYEAGSGLAALIGLHQDAGGGGLDLALSYAWGIGSARALLLATSFREETETDLFGEQAVLCGGIPELVKAGYDTLVEAGYHPEVAYFECLHEAKLITDLLYERGLAGMRSAISETAAWGGLTAGPKVIGPEARASMRELLRAIQDGSFARDWIAENAAGLPHMQRLEAEEAAHGSGAIGAEIRRELGIDPENEQHRKIASQTDP